ncbi:hypothetical protein J5N97_014286 [Dioscorea zingiberensis]|uniref:Pentatricopeptide repeat-containing protein n=1 Tax=Dioscorea zingiberensis TaxID=325984 RepID=A0A9D5HJX3_9LILI|nr:hypothetical protein J5N97_014286 [Dioscorea zingiberensis]
MRALLLGARKFTNTSWNPPLTRFRNYEAILNALTQPSIALPSLEGLHALIITNGLSSKSVLSCRLISSYLSISGLQHAHKVFDYLPKRSSHAYNHILSAYIDQEHYRAVFKLYFQMLSAGEALPDVVTFSIILKACVALNSLPHGMLVHGHVLEFGMESDLRLATDILILYTKCGSLDFAVKQFELMHQRDAFAWTAMVDGYLRLGCVAEALDMFGKMRELGLTASVVTWNAFDIWACSCIFERVVTRDAGLWNAMMVGYGMHGYCEEALSLFHRMRVSGVRPNEITFSCILSACSHSGLVTEGRRIYDIMISEYKILARQEHYACMVDMLGRAGYLEDAFVFIKNLPEEPTRDVWGAFLSACRVHSDAKLAEIATENLMRFTSGSADAGYHIAMSNVYAENGRWGKMAQLRTQMRDVGLKKRVGYSWIEVGILSILSVWLMIHIFVQMRYTPC